MQLSLVVVRCKHCRPTSTCTYRHARVRNALFAQGSGCGVDIFHAGLMDKLLIYHFFKNPLWSLSSLQASCSTEQGSHRALKQSQTLTIRVTACVILECQDRPNPPHLRSQRATIVPGRKPEIGFNLQRSQPQ